MSSYKNWSSNVNVERSLSLSQEQQNDSHSDKTNPVPPIQEPNHNPAEDQKKQ